MSAAATTLAQEPFAAPSQRTAIPRMTHWTARRSGAGLRVRGTLHNMDASPRKGFVLTGVEEITLVDGRVCALLGQGRWVELAVGADAGSGLGQVA